MWKVVVPTLPSFRYQLVRTFPCIVCRYSTDGTNLETKADNESPISSEHLPTVQDERDDLQRLADKIMEERQLRIERRAQGIMYDEEILDGRVVHFNYANEYVEQRGIGEVHSQLRNFMICCALLGAVTLAFVKIDLKKKRRRKMWERQNILYEAKKKAIQQQKQQQQLAVG